MLENLSKCNYYACMIYRQILHSQPAPMGYGGCQGEIYGEKGTGKTILLAKLASDLALRGIPVVWRFRPKRDHLPYILSLLPEDHDVPINFWVYETDEPHFFEQDGLSLKRVEIEYKNYSRPSELVNRKIKKGLNVVLAPSTSNEDYEPSEKFIDEVMTLNPAIEVDELYKVRSGVFWFEFAWSLVHRKNRKFIAFMFDEMSEWCPANQAGALYHLNGILAMWINDFRGTNIHFFFTAHDSRDIDWRVYASRIEFSFYFRGARVRDKHRVKQENVDMLKNLQYWVAHGYYFGFGVVFPPKTNKILFAFADEKGEIPF